MACVPRQVVLCDHCSRQGPAAPDSRTANARAARAGWVEGRGPFGLDLHLCPECQSGERPDWWPGGPK